MSDITSTIAKMNDQEISSDAALSQALFLKIGANINGLIDRGARNVTFTASGQWTCPADVTRVTLLGAGGGGGGGGAGTDTQVNSGGAGGNGSIAQSVSVVVAPNTTYTVTIGAGGNGGDASQTLPAPGSPGGATSFGSLATFDGASGGGGTGQSVGSSYSPRLIQTASGVGQLGSRNAAVGQSSISTKGGTVYASQNGALSGGGGGAGVGDGGNGGSGNGTAATNQPTVGGISAGGGGGYYLNTSNGTYGVGAKGGNGFLLISY